MRAIVFFILFFSGTVNVSAQKYVLADTIKANKLIAVVRDSLQYDQSRRILLADEALAISKYLNYGTGIAESSAELGDMYAQSGDNKNAIKYLNEALRACEANKQYGMEGWVCFTYGTLYTNSAQSDSAFILFSRALKLFEQTKDTPNIGATYSALANTYFVMGDTGSADKYLQRALSILKQANSPMLVASIYGNLGMIHPKKDLFYNLMAVKILDSIGDSISCGNIYQNIGADYFLRGNPDSALIWYARALRISRMTGNKNLESSTLLNIGDDYRSQNNINEAEKYYKASLTLARAITNYRSMHFAGKYLSEICYNEKKFDNAYRYLLAADTAKDSMISVEKVKSLAELTTKYEVKQVQDRNVILQNENDIQKLKIRQKNILAYSGFSAALLFLVIGGLVVRQGKLKAYQEKLELEQKQLLAQINPHFIFNCLNSIQQFVIQNDTMNANKYLADFALLMRQTLDNSKDGIISLTREIEYLENYLLFEQMRFEDKFSYALLYAPDVNPDAVYIPSMIIQPFVENAIKHGLCNLTDRKGLLKISFFKKENFLYCEVDDNGIGMDEANKIKENSFLKFQSHGMDITRRRLALVSKMRGSDYDIAVINKNSVDNQPEGTTIIIKFPLQT